MLAAEMRGCFDASLPRIIGKSLSPSPPPGHLCSPSPTVLGKSGP